MTSREKESWCIRDLRKKCLKIANERFDEFNADRRRRGLKDLWGSPEQLADFMFKWCMSQERDESLKAVTFH